MLVNDAGREDGIPELTDGVSLPVLQDTGEDDVFGAYGASQWYIYLVDRQLVPRVVHYGLDLDDDRARLLGEIDTLRKEAR